MISVATSLAKALPKPTYTGEHEELPNQSRGSRILGPGSLDETQVVLKVSLCLPGKATALTDSLAAKWTSSIRIKNRMAPKVSGGLWRWRGVS